MREQDHIKAAQQWEKVADENLELDFVLPQAYFYATINYIEAILARRDIDPRDHEDRASHLRDAFGFNAIDREMHERLLSGRREAGYRSRNGEKLRRIKQAFEHFKTKWQNSKN